MSPFGIDRLTTVGKSLVMAFGLAAALMLISSRGTRPAAAATQAPGAATKISVKAPATVAPGTPVISSIPAVILVGGSFNVTGSGFTAGSVVNFFVATGNGPVNEGPLKPNLPTSPTLLTVPVPATIPLGQGFVSVMVINTDQDYTPSNTASALLQGNPAAGIPTLAGVNGKGLDPTSSNPAYATNNIDAVIKQGATVTLTGTGFDVKNGVAIDIFNANLKTGGKSTVFLNPGNPGLAADKLTFTLPLDVVTGPGSIVASNRGSDGSYSKKSNAVAVPVGAPIVVSSVVQLGTTSTIAVTGTGFSDLTVINLFNAQHGGGSVNLGGLGASGPKIPLTVSGSTKFTFTMPTAAVPGATYVQSIEPPFVPYDSSGGAFIFKERGGPTPTSSPTPEATPAPSLTPAPTSTSTPKPTGGFTGHVMSGLTNPISGASVHLYAMGYSGYGSAPTLLATAISDSSGSFGLPLGACPAGNPQTYIVVSGGNAGDGNNSAIGLMAVSGPCDSLSRATTVTVNELTTVAAAWGLAQFTDSTGRNVGTSSTNATGLANAVTQIRTDLVDTATGAPAAFLPAECPEVSPPANCDALERLNTLADILAGCVQGSGPSSPSCARLFDNTASSKNTLQAAHVIATNPTANVNALFDLVPPAPPFSPVLSDAPDNLVLALNFPIPVGPTSWAIAMAVDSASNLFMAIADYTGKTVGSVVELTAASGYTASLNFAPAAAEFSTPDAIAVDTANNVFVTNSAGNSVSKLSPPNYTTAQNFAPAAAAFDHPHSLALNASGNIFVANGTGNSVSELTAASGYATGLNFAPVGAAFNGPISVAVDATANVFVVNILGNSVSELTAASGYTTGLNFAPAAAAFNVPFSLALGPTGNIFVTNADGNSLSDLIAPGYATARNFTSSAFNDPQQLAVDSEGNVFVANWNGINELTAASGYATGLHTPFTVVMATAVNAGGNVFALSATGVSELVGLAGPTALAQACLKKGLNVCKP